MTYRYRDADGHEIETVPELDFDGQPVVTLWARGEFATVPVRIPVDQFEEFIAGARDTARQAAGQEPARLVKVDGVLTEGDANTAREAIRQMAADPYGLKAGLIVQPYRDHGQEKWVFRCWGTATCDGWLSLDHYSQQSAERARDRHVTEEHQ